MNKGILMSLGLCLLLGDTESFAGSSFRQMAGQMARNINRTVPKIKSPIVRAQRGIGKESLELARQAMIKQSEALRDPALTRGMLDSAERTALQRVNDAQYAVLQNQLRAGALRDAALARGMLDSAERTALQEVSVAQYATLESQLLRDAALKRGLADAVDRTALQQVSETQYNKVFGTLASRGAAVARDVNLQLGKKLAVLLENAPAQLQAFQKTMQQGAQQLNLQAGNQLAGLLQAAPGYAQQVKSGLGDYVQPLGMAALLTGAGAALGTGAYALKQREKEEVERKKMYQDEHAQANSEEAFFLDNLGKDLKDEADIDRALGTLGQVKRMEKQAYEAKKLELAREYLASRAAHADDIAFENGLELELRREKDADEILGTYDAIMAAEMERVRARASMKAARDRRDARDSWSGYFRVKAGNALDSARNAFSNVASGAGSYLPSMPSVPSISSVRDTLGSYMPSMQDALTPSSQDIDPETGLLRQVPQGQ